MVHLNGSTTVFGKRKGRVERILRKESDLFTIQAFTVSSTQILVPSVNSFVPSSGSTQMVTCINARQL